jgi:hypothetical protein
MRLTPIKKEERTILIAMAVGYALIFLVFIGWGVYLLSRGIYTFEILVYAICPNIVLVVFNFSPLERYSLAICIS